jgi:hypothetical protein
MKKVIYSQTRQSEIVKVYFFFIAICLMAIGSLTVSIISGKRSTLFFIVPFIGMLVFMYFFFRDFIKYGADIEINSENFIINNKNFDYRSLIEIGQCQNRQLIYFIFRDNDQESKFVGFNRFTHKELFILNDKTLFVEKLQKITNSTN